jgi:peptidyl-prolyl cis-trans isomerase B (cyclophilin B)
LKKLFIVLIAALICISAVQAEETNPKVRLITSRGEIILELNRIEAPKTVENFLAYVNSGFYDNTIFHRVIKGFMVQGGGLSESMERKPTLSPIENEADNGLKNLAGSIAMARTQNPHSATSQFFINTVDNHSLDHRNKSMQGWGYCVFGKVTDGLFVVKGIENISTTTRNGRRDVPRTPVFIKQIIIVSK